MKTKLLLSAATLLTLAACSGRPSDEMSAQPTVGTLDFAKYSQTAASVGAGVWSGPIALSDAAPLAALLELSPSSTIVQLTLSTQLSDCVGSDGAGTLPGPIAFSLSNGGQANILCGSGFINAGGSLALNYTPGATLPLSAINGVNVAATTNKVALQITTQRVDASRLNVAIYVDGKLVGSGQLGGSNLGVGGVNAKGLAVQGPGAGQAVTYGVAPLPKEVMGKGKPFDALEFESN